MRRKNHENANLRYEDLFLLFSMRVEKVLKMILLTMLVALIVFQAALQIPSIRHWLVKVERLEGNPYTSSAEISLEKR